MKHLLLTATALFATAHASAAQSDAELARQLSNPIAALIQVPFQFNYDSNIGPNRDGDKFYTNVQPVVPTQLNADWNVISRTIVPIVSQNDIAPNSGSQTGVGDILQSVFFSPTKPTANGLIWGVGPAFLLPSGTDPLLSQRKWGTGPTAVALIQANGWTYGMLANHIWSFAGEGSRPGISSTFLQPFVSYTTKDLWTFGLNTESTYDWKHDQWSTPVNAFASRLVKFGKQPVSIGGGLRYWAASPDSGPHGWGCRVILTFLLPN